MGLAVITSLVFAACAHQAEKDGDHSKQAAVADDAQIRKVGPGTTNDFNDSESDLNGIPLEVNRLVLEWIDYFQGQGREHMERYLARSTRYLPMMKEVLRKEGLPEDLVYIALIESGFSPAATSSASAVGYWQFIRATGRTYGLQIDPYVDERRDFVRSTEAAAAYFKSLYNLFGSWYLAIASYNVGENRIKNVVMRYHTRDFWEMARNKKLPLETIHYIPKFLAARMIAKEPEKYGFSQIDYQPALDYSEIQLTQAVDLKNMAKEMSIDYVDLKDLNPMYRRGIAVDRNGKLTLRVPKGSEEKATLAAANSIVTDRKVFAVADDDDVTFYRIRRGESISAVARKFHITTRRLRAINGFTSRTRLVAGKKIKVPNDLSVGMESPPLANRKVAAQSRLQSNSKSHGSHERVTRDPNQAVRVVHVVKPGETLLNIAHHYRVSLTKLASYNQLRRRSKILVGARLEIPD
jgi:membrane-bound lytic murein transglycosylase D